MAARPVSTDSAWQDWGLRDPYYAVLTNPKYRSASLSPEVKAEFLESGRFTVDYVLETCRRFFDVNFRPQRVLDFGCGVARMSIAFAEQAHEVLGMDISRAMLAEAKLNCVSRGCTNVILVQSDDALSAAPGQFDLVHSCLVLQHLEVPRGRLLFGELVNKVKPGGCGVIQITFGWDVYQETFGAVPVAPPPPTDLISRFTAIRHKLATRLGLTAKSNPPELLPDPASVDPEMQMNFYNLNELTFILQQSGVQRVLTDFTNHGGALGGFMFFRKPSST
jgi:SAM-dependent methyltransferase